MCLHIWNAITWPWHRQPSRRCNKEALKMSRSMCHVLKRNRRWAPPHSQLHQVGQWTPWRWQWPECSAWRTHGTASSEYARDYRLRICVRAKPPRKPATSFGLRLPEEIQQHEGLTWPLFGVAAKDLKTCSQALAHFRMLLHPIRIRSRSQILFLNPIGWIATPHGSDITCAAVPGRRQEWSATLDV